MSEELEGRLRRMEVGRSVFGGVPAGAFHSKPINPDGHEAADLLKRYREALMGRDDFLVDRGLWNDFLETLPEKPRP